MASGSHLSKELFELIKSIGEARSKQEEDRIIANESVVLATKIKAPKIKDKSMKEYIIRSIYIEMLGHNADFSHIDAINLCQTKNIPLKRVAYLACTLFLSTNHPQLILLVASLQRDLQSKNYLEITGALTTICFLVNDTIIQAISEPVFRLLNHSHPLVRKKAVMAVHKFWRVDNSLRETIDEKMKKALCDKEPAVMAASLNYYAEVIKVAPDSYKDLISSFVVILKQIIEHRLPKDFDYHRMPAPWVQMKLLQILSYLGEYDQSASENMYEVLGQVMKRADDLGINIGYAIVYQSLKTITTIYPNGKLITSASTTISRFITSENRNLKYIGIDGLSQIVSIDPKFVLQYQGIVVDCLEDMDETLKRKTIDLLYRMTNYQNVSVIVDKLLQYLSTTSTDSIVRKDLVIKINQLAERFSINEEWFVKTINKLFEMSGELITPDISNHFIKLISEWEIEAEGDMFKQNTLVIYIAILNDNPNISDSMMQVIAWVIGEYGGTTLKGELMTEVINLLCAALGRQFSNGITKAWILQALTKLHKSLNFTEIPILEEIFRKYTKSKRGELQQRALEYLSMKKIKEISLTKLLSAAESPIDMELRFLDGYVSASKTPGYSEEMSSNYLLGPEEKSLKFGVYHNTVRGQHVGDIESNPLYTKEVVLDKELKREGKDVWTVEGYQGDLRRDTGKEKVFKTGGGDTKTALDYTDFQNDRGVGVDTVDSKQGKREPTDAGGISTKSSKSAKVGVDEGEGVGVPKSDKAIFTENLFAGFGESGKVKNEAPIKVEEKSPKSPKSKDLFSGMGMRGGGGSVPTPVPAPVGEIGEGLDLLELNSGSRVKAPEVDLLVQAFEGGGEMSGSGSTSMSTGSAPTVSAPTGSAPTVSAPTGSAPTVSAPILHSPPDPPSLVPVTVSMGDFENMWLTYTAQSTFALNTPHIHTPGDVFSPMEHLNFMQLAIMGPECIMSSKLSTSGQICLFHCRVDQGQCHITLKSKTPLDNPKYIVDAINNALAK